MNRVSMPLVLIFCSLVGGTTPVFAQNGRIEGLVTDPQRAAVAGAQVVVTSAGGGTRTVTTDAAGRFAVTALEPAVYDVEVRAQGFRPMRQTALQVSAGEPRSVDFTLTIESYAESVSVTGEATEAAGYKPGTVTSLGLFGRKPIEDVPYSVNVVPASFIQNKMATSTDDLYKVNPVIQVFSTATRGGSGNFGLRGFTQANVSGKAEDGMPVQNLAILTLEDKERVETYTGFTSLLFGATNVGGLINYAYKRPVAARLTQVNVGTYGGSAGFLHADLGGVVVPSGRFTYRLNVLGVNGSPGVDTRDNRQALASGALTWQVARSAAVTVLGSTHDQKMTGAEVFWSFATNPDGSSRVFHPDAPDPAKNFGQPFALSATHRNRGGADFNWAINPMLTLRTSYGHARTHTYGNIFVNNNVTAAGPTYSQAIAQNTDFYDASNTGYAFVDASVETGSVRHKLTGGFFGNGFTQRRAPQTFATITLNNLNYETPIYVDEPTFVASGSDVVRVSSHNRIGNIVVGDDVRFNERWSALVGLTRTLISTEAFNTTTGLQTSSYERGRVSPSASLIFKPAPKLSTYATYSQSLQGGQVVTSSANMTFTNNGTILAPYLGKEYEGGVKADVGALLVTAAVFRIDQALQFNQFNSDGTYTAVQDGQQINRGIEIVATGRVHERIRMFGGATYVDARVSQARTSVTAPAIDGLRPPNVVKSTAKMTSEYDAPFAGGLTFTGGVYFMGSRAIDRLNTEFLPSFATVDLGGRYRLRQLPFGRDLTLRLDVRNVSNKRYWVAPPYVGQPRTVALSASTAF